MIEIRYSLIVEGFAEVAFIPAILDKIGGGRFKWIKSPLSAAAHSTNISRVLRRIPELSETALLRNKEHLFIAGVDLDQADHDRDLPLWNEARDRILKTIPPRVPAEKVIIFIPIQAIDHWLLYLEDQRIAPNGAESRSIKEVKQLVYGKNANEREIKLKAKSLAYVPNAVEILSNKSRSFKHFAKEVNDFITRFESNKGT